MTTPQQPKKRKFSATEITILAIISILQTLNTYGGMIPPRTIRENPIELVAGIIIRMAIYALVYAGLRWLYRKIKGWWKP